MVNLSLLIVVIFAVIEIRSEDSPISPEEQIDLEKRFSEVDLKRARDVGFSDRSILRSTANGWTLDEMIILITSAQQHENATVKHFCDRLFPNQNATTLTSAQEIKLNNLYRVTHFLGESDQRPFTKSILCAYSAQPDSFDAEANSFGSDFLLYMKIRYLKTKVQNATGVRRTRLAKEMCCLYEGTKDETVDYTNTDLRDEDLDNFNNQWDAFALANTSKALEIVCDFLHAKTSFKECPEYVFS